MEFSHRYLLRTKAYENRIPLQAPQVCHLCLPSSVETNLRSSEHPGIERIVALRAVRAINQMSPQIFEHHYLNIFQLSN